MFLSILHKIEKWSIGIAFLGLISVINVGCSDDNPDFVIPDNPGNGFINISLNCVESTRAEGDEKYIESDDRFNEDLISFVTVCLWPNDATLNDNESGEYEAKPYYVQEFDVKQKETAIIRIPLSDQLVNTLFNTQNKCNVFVAANVKAPHPEGDFTIGEFRDMVIKSKFATEKLQMSFAMDGDGEITLETGTKLTPETFYAHGDVELKRSASKITLALNVEKTVEQAVVVDGKLESSIWAPITSGMQVYLRGGLKESTLDPKMDYIDNSDLFFNTPIDTETPYKFIKNKEKENPNGNNPGDYTYPFIQDVPFYSYPHVWTAQPDDYASTFMLLSIPWMQIETDGEGKPVTDENGNFVQKPNSSIRTCYYQVPAIAANSEKLQLVRNVSYHVYLHVGILGSFIPDEPLLLEDLEYSAAEWGTVNMDVKIPDVRYLVVDQNDYTVNNETSITIPFYTSHKITVVSAKMTFYRYNFTEAGIEHAVTVDQNQNDLTYQKSGGPNSPNAYHVFTADFNDNNELVVTHDLKIFVPYNNRDQEVSLTNDDTWNCEPKTRKPSLEKGWDDVVNSIAYYKKQDLNSTQSPTINDEYSKVEFEIVVQHEDINKDGNKTDFKETITITQYPGMYIEAVKNYTEENAEGFDYSGVQGDTFINNNNINIGSGSATEIAFGIDVSGVNHYLSAGNSEGWMASIGIHSADGYLNWNPNLYLVTVTQLPQGTDYIIGEPRTNKINNYLGSKGYDVNNPNKVYDYNGSMEDEENTILWKGQTYTYDYYKKLDNIVDKVERTVTVTGFKEIGGKVLQYYYPAMEDENHKMMIAPKFRICSSYAGTGWVLNRELARRRAAAFQELNYPAGRWRLPTFGEVSFIMQLCAEYKLPRLFGAYENNWWYWCAQGLVAVPQKKLDPNNTPNYAEASKIKLCDVVNGKIVLPNTQGDHAAQRARFVYDEWYWGPADLGGKTQFYSPGNYPFRWGDEPYQTKSSSSN